MISFISRMYHPAIGRGTKKAVTASTKDVGVNTTKHVKHCKPQCFNPLHPMPRLMQTGIFIDADNVNTDIVRKAIHMAKNTQWMNVGHIRAYKDWNKEPTDSAAVQALENEGVELIHVSRIAKKNSSDIKMCVDIAKLLHTSELEVYVLVTGDSDFKHILIEIRNEGKASVVCGCDNRKNNWLKRFSDSYVSLAEQ